MPVPQPSVPSLWAALEQTPVDELVAKLAPATFMQWLEEDLRPQTPGELACRVGLQTSLQGHAGRMAEAVGVSAA